MTRVLLAVVLAVCVAVGTAGCDERSAEKGGGAPAAKKAETTKDSAGGAVEAAEKAMESVAADAVPISVGSGGVVFSPPPSSWQILLVSESTGKLYRVSVEHGKALAPEEMGKGNVSGLDVGKALSYSDLKVGSDEAYKRALEFLEAKGEVPPNVMMSVSLASIEGVDSKAGEWNLLFTRGTSKEGSLQAVVDGDTGEVRQLDR